MEGAFLPEFITAFFGQRSELLWLTVVAVDLGMTILLYRFFGKLGLYAVIVLDVMLCNVMGPKIVNIFGFNTTMGAVLYAGIYFATDMLSEKYGRREANRAVILGFCTATLTVLYTQLYMLFQPTTAPAEAAALATTMDSAQRDLFGVTPQLLFASLIAYLISQTHDVYMFHFIKRLTKGKHLWIRNNGSTIVSQLIDTITFSSIAWIGILPLGQALALGMAQYGFKVTIAVIDTGFMYWAVRWNVRERDWSEYEGDAKSVALEP